MNHSRLCLQCFGSLVILMGLGACNPETSVSSKMEPSSAVLSQNTTINALEASVYTQINQYRQSRNLSPLRLDPFLSDQARRYSETVAQGQISFNNTNFETQFESIREQIPFDNVRINLAYNQGYTDPATATVQNWLDSASHRQNLEGDFDLTGVGIARNPEGEYYFTQILLQEIPQISAGSLRELEQEVHQQVNQYRQSRGLPLLGWDERITQQARLHAEAMARGSATFSHDGFEQRVDMIGALINYRSAAENLAYNQGYQDPVNRAVKGWIESPGHHQNMIGDFNLTGIGVARNDEGEYYMNQIFIKTP